MKATIKVLGVQRVDFTNSDTGEHIAGFRLWYSTPTKDPAWNGCCVNKAWFQDDNPLSKRVFSLKPDSYFEAEFDIRGKKIFDLVPSEG